MPQMDPTSFSPQVVWLVITFVALFLIMWKVVVPNISGALEARQRRISDNLDKAAEFKKEAEAALQAYEAALAEARTEAHGVMATAAEAMADEAAKREHELAETLAAEITASEARIAEAVESAIHQVGTVAAEATAAAVERLIGEAPDQGAVDKAVSTALKTRGSHV